jgi:hypothetical protein
VSPGPMLTPLSPQSVSAEWPRFIPQSMSPPSRPTGFRH